MTNDLKFSGESPVVINYNGSPDDIYAPVRTSSCDINIVSNKILDDLYTAKKDEICVRIKKGNTTIWEGYKMPNTYSQEVSLNLDNITMTCIDPVSILKFVTVDKILEKPNIVTYKTLIGKALAYVMLDANTLWVERTVSYDGAYDGTNGLLDLSVQVSNFWDESDKPSTVYEVIEEMLRPFCMTLVYYNNSYQIYNPNKLTGTRHFDIYTIGQSGALALTTSDSTEVKNSGLYDFNNDDWKSNNVSTPTVEIDSTYNKVTGVASTSVPAYSKMITDIIKYTNKDSYAYNGLNVQRNKTKGYVKDVRNIVIDPTHSHSTVVIEPVTEDRWFYVWNGCYCDANYNLTDSGGYTNWYNTCNKAYNYLTGYTGHPDNWGAALTFSGGAENQTGTGKVQSTDRSVKIKDRITAYAADNGVPPEFLETSDLGWTFSSGTVSTIQGMLNKTNPTDSRFGTGITQGSSNRIVYHQTYENVCLSMNDDKTVDLKLSQSYSRTGIDVPINVMSNNTTTNKTYSGSGAGRILSTCNTDYFPPQWNATAVTVDSFYFRRLSTNGTPRATARPLWDERVVRIYIQLSNGAWKQFNGKNWVDDDGDHSMGFRLTKLMNGEQVYHNELNYDMIISSADANYETLSPVRYYLGNEEKKIYLDSDGGVVEEETNDYILCRPYFKEDNAWYTWIADCSEGNLSIKLPYIEDAAATVYVDIYNSSLLGMTGNDGAVTGVDVEHYFPFYYTLSDTTETTPNFKEIEKCCATFMPSNISHIKAEHLDLEVGISVPESNLGQMFSESDIKYELNSNQDYVEEFEGPSFLVNSFNPLVASSFSYLIYNNAIADPNLFIVASRTGRPEAFVVQAYFNWLSKIRKIYTKTLIPYPNYVRTRPFSNVRCYLKSPEVGTNELLVVKDSWDVKTDRHTVTTVEDQDMEVGVVSNVDVIEIPRMARAERYNLPTAIRKTYRS